MQEQEASANIPVVAVSTMDGQDAALRVIRAVASDFLTKAFNSTLLYIRVESAIAKTGNDAFARKTVFFLY